MLKVDYLRKRLRELREAKGLTQLQLAENLEIGRVSVSNYENGDRTPDIDLIIKFADFFDVSTDYLLGRSEFKNFSQEYEFFRKRLGLAGSSTFLNPFRQSLTNDDSDLPPILLELQNLMVLIDEDYTTIITEILTGNEKFRMFALDALNKLLRSVVYTAKVLKEKNYDDDMYYYIEFLTKLKDTTLSPSDFGHIQADQKQIKACSRFFNEFISLYAYSIIDPDNIYGGIINGLNQKTR